MPYKKVRVAFEDGSRRDYIQNRTREAIYQAPDTPAGKASLDRRRDSR